MARDVGDTAQGQDHILEGERVSALVNFDGDGALCDPRRIGIVGPDPDQTLQHRLDKELA